MPDSSFWNIDPTLFFDGQHCRVHDSLRLRALEKGRDARTVVQNGVDELHILVVTESDERVALARVARRTGPFQKFFRQKSAAVQLLL